MTCCPLCRQELPDTGLLWDLTSGDILYKGRTVRLTPREMEIFSVLAKSMNRPIPVDRLIATVYGQGSWPEYKTISVFLVSVRRKIKILGLRISNNRYYGYILEQERMS